MLLGQLREYFFLILIRKEGKIIHSPLVLRSPSNSLFNQEVVFSVTMMSRLDKIDREYIEELISNISKN